MQNEHNPAEVVTILAFLPYSSGNKSAPVATAIQNLMSAESFGHVSVLHLDDKVKDVARKIATAHMQARLDSKECLLIFTADKGSLGVSLPEVDAVAFLDNGKSADKYVQRAFR